MTGNQVLLCALPTLLSMPSHISTSFSLPVSGSSTLPTSSSAFDFNSVIHSDYDWLRSPSGVMMDLDVDEKGRNSRSDTNPRRLQFVDVDSEALGLGDLDISFEASPSEDGKIRVKIHSPPSDSGSTSHSTKSESRRRSSSSLAMWAGTQSDSNYATPYSPPTFSTFPASSTDSDPFLGANSVFGLNSPMSAPMSMGEFSSPVGFGQHTMYSLESDFAAPAGHVGGKRRVRIALKSMPAAGGEGGEWEVEVR